MSQFIPRAAVAKENYMQMVRRNHLEKQHESAIKGFQEVLKTKTTILQPLMALGFTKAHAVAVEIRLVMLNELEERRAAQEALKAKADAVKPEETLTVKVSQEEFDKLTHRECGTSEVK